MYWGSSRSLRSALVTSLSVKVCLRRIMFMMSLMHQCNLVHYLSLVFLSGMQSILKSHLSTLRASPRSTRRAALSGWSPKMGKANMGTEWYTASRIPVIPQWVTNSTVLGCARRSCWGNQGTNRMFSGILHVPCYMFLVTWGNQGTMRMLSGMFSTRLGSNLMITLCSSLENASRKADTRNLGTSLGLKPV